jgi:hypothetical protein
MPERAFTRGQTQVLYRFLPGAIFPHDDYGLCRVESVATVDPGRINRRALFETLSEVLRQWEREDFRAGFPDPRDESRRRMYRVGQPDKVYFTPFPRVLQCRKCKHVVKYDNIRQDGHAPPGGCPRPGCGGRLSQLPYVQVHNCGRMQEIHVPEQGCPTPGHGRNYLRFFDPGRTQKARWVCGLCSREIQKPRMTPCNCAYTAALEELERARYERYLRLYPTGEPGLYLPQVVPFINFPEEEERQLTEVDDSHALLLARLWGLLSDRVIDVVTQRRKWAPGGAALDPNMAAAIEALRRLDPNNEALRNLESVQANPPGQEAIDRVKSLLPCESLTAIPPGRRLAEHVALLDCTDLTDVATVANRLRVRGTSEQADEFEQACREIMDQLGLGSVQVINDLPIAMAAIGYTRVSRART